MAISQAVIDQLLNHADIVKIIQHYMGVKNVRQRGSNRNEFIALCPFHGERSPSFSVTKTKQFYHCFGCGSHGDAIKFVMEYSGLSFVEAVFKVAELSGIHVPSGQTKPARARRRIRKATRDKKKRRAHRKHEEERHVAWNRRKKAEPESSTVYPQSSDSPYDPGDDIPF